MSLNISVTKKIVVNGKEYGSLEEIPEEFRQALAKAIAGSRDAGRREISFAVSGPITFNDKVYPDEAAMPPDVREMYKGLMKAVGGGKPVTASRSGFRIGLKPGREAADPITAGPEPITPGFFSPAMRKFLLAAGIAVLVIEILLRFFPS